MTATGFERLTLKQRGGAAALFPWSATLREGRFRALRPTEPLPTPGCGQRKRSGLAIRANKNGVPCSLTITYNVLAITGIGEQRSLMPSSALGSVVPQHPT